MTALVERVVWVSLATSLLLLPLLGLSGAIRRRYRAGSCYLLWLVLALRLLIPLPVPVPVGTALSQVVPAPAAEETLVSLPGISGPASVRGPQAGGAGGAAELTEALSWLWAAGAVLFLGVEGGGYLRARRKILEGSQARAGDQAALEALGGTVPVLRAGVDTPMTLGLLRPVIVLPPEVPEADLPLILRHELCHIRRRDLWYKGVMLLANAVHWFNPLVWRMAGQAGRDLELYCDEAVVEGQDNGFRRRYGQVLLQASSGGVTAALTTRLGGTEMKGRIMNLTKKEGDRSGGGCGVRRTALRRRGGLGALFRRRGPGPSPGGGGAAPAGDGERGPQRRREPGALHSARAGGGRGLEGADLRPLRGGGPGLHERPPGHAGRLGTGALL